MEPKQEPSHATNAFSSPSLEQERERLVPIIKEFRKMIDGLIQRTHVPSIANPNSIVTYHYPAPLYIQQVETKLIEAKMWAGKILEVLGNPLPPELADKMTAPPNPEATSAGYTLGMGGNKAPQTPDSKNVQ